MPAIVLPQRSLEGWESLKAASAKLPAVVTTAGKLGPLPARVRTKVARRMVTQTSSVREPSESSNHSDSLDSIQHRPASQSSRASALIR